MTELPPWNNACPTRVTLEPAQKALPAGTLLAVFRPWRPHDYLVASPSMIAVAAASVLP